MTEFVKANRLMSIAAIGFRGQQSSMRPKPKCADAATATVPLWRHGPAGVVYDFRSGDMAAGGHGAPCPVYHAALLTNTGRAGNGRP